MSFLKKVMNSGLAAGEMIKKNPAISVCSLPLQASIGDSLKKLYNEGKDEGKKEGYSQASNIYEQKLLEQAEKFKNEKSNLKQNIDDYKKLLNKYEEYISKQEQNIEQLSKEKLLLLYKIKDKYIELKNLD